MVENRTKKTIFRIESSSFNIKTIKGNFQNDLFYPYDCWECANAFGKINIDSQCSKLNQKFIRVVTATRAMLYKMNHRVLTLELPKEIFKITRFYLYESMQLLLAKYLLSIKIKNIIILIDSH